MKVSLNPELERFVEEKVRAGKYQSADEVVNSAVAMLRQQGSALKQGHGGIGASSHMACLLFTAEIGVKPTLVAYRGSAPALHDLVGGHVDFMCEQSVSVAETVLAGSVKAYAVSASERLANLPDVPTAKEAGISYEMSVWAGLFAPKGTSSAVVAKLADALDKALDEAAVRQTLTQLGGSIPAKAERNPADPKNRDPRKLVAVATIG